MTRAPALRVALAALALALLAPAGASAQTPFRGVTDQGRELTFSVLDDASVGSVITKYRIRCSGGRRFRVQRSVFVPPDEGGTKRFVVGIGRYRVAGRGGRIGLVRVRLEGRRRGPAADLAAQRWTGVLRATMSVRRHGRREAPCSLRTRWSARAEGIGAGSWTFERPPEVRPVDDVAGPFEVVRSPAGGVAISASTEDENVLEAYFRGPALNGLEQGRTYEGGGPPGAAQGSLLVGNDPCSDGVARFTVERLQSDRLRRITGLTITYERRCSDHPPERGRIDWTAANP